MTDIRIITSSISREELNSLAQERFGDMVKAVVDIERKIMAIGGEMHADEEQILLADGSKQSDLWGINLYPNDVGEDFVEFDSMINIRPSQGNRSRSVEDKSIQRRIREVVSLFVE